MQHKFQFLIFLKYGLVGLATASVYFIVMWLSSEVIGWNYRIAISLAYFVSTIVHYCLNRSLTFRAYSGGHIIQLGRYLVAWVINYCLTMIVVVFCVEKLGLSTYLGVCFAVIITICSGFFLLSKWVFRIN